MQPSVQATGYVNRAGMYKKISDKGGVIEFTLACELDNPRVGDPSPLRFFKVEKWVKDDDPSLVGRLSDGVPVSVEGVWICDRVGEKEYHKIKASRLYIIEPKDS